MSLVSFSPGFLCGPCRLRPAQVVLPEEIGTQKLPFGVLGQEESPGWAGGDAPSFFGTFWHSWMMAEWWDAPSLWHIVAIFWWLNDGRMMIDDGIRMYILRWRWWSTVSTVSNCQAPYFQADPKWSQRFGMMIPNDQRAKLWFFNDRPGM